MDHKTVDGKALKLARNCDDKAENDNYHSMVGLHEWLYDLLRDHTGPEATLAVFKAIHARGGLHNV